MKQLRFTPSAQGDLVRLFRWYEKKASTDPVKISAEVDRTTEKLVLNPVRYAKVARCPAARDVRITAAKKRKMIVIYETTGTEVVILSLSHKSAKRRPWRKRLDEV